jgi:hypothetical protein
MAKVGCAALILILAAGPAHAGRFDGTRPFLCATTDVYACTLYYGCERVTADMVDAPRFLHVSPAEKVVNGERPSGVVGEASIEHMRHQDGRLVVQGLAAGLGWTLDVSDDSGDMRLAASDDAGSYVVFGNCTGQ